MWVFLFNKYGKITTQVQGFMQLQVNLSLVTH